MDLNFYHKTCSDFEEFLMHSCPKIEGFHPYFQNAFWEMLLSGGKRFRPKLLLAIVSGSIPSLAKNAFLPALALECLHTYSLIHDDLPAMDNADLRRGHRTLHKLYDETGAILVGDGLNTYAFYLLSIARLDEGVKIKLIEELSYNGGIGGMVIGQAMDCYFENKTLELEKLELIHLNKTAKLIASSLKMGAIISNLSIDIQNQLYDFGLKLGLYFQIRDDIIDATQSESQAGKNTSADGNKNSYVNLLGLQGAKQNAKDLCVQIIEMIEKYDMPIRKNLEDLLSGYLLQGDE
ncbi:polyprenyl synthetase family protein [Helicobacter cappadocius]|uniref:Polyprenyl synthetase family protein n=1 Tax=Helicobacter cappadocius TaxID=3063998 RepID=A0AA90Q1G8_9HELI|nr:MULTISPECIES: polyprenyl synthetase family protein [unclassified Helicobacter]MDO7252556.1 polyprenyl synthetase family protein [Helicobacter sp. faydin-H75]MDP2538423.1 polyprenyl synthetase family protein [Helicobacter sp. faydin-H76]